MQAAALPIIPFMLISPDSRQKKPPGKGGYRLSQAVFVIREPGAALAAL
jgi:hypothetical protein